MMFCAQRGCSVPTTHTGPLCPVCNHPLQDDANKQPASVSESAAQPSAPSSRKKKPKPATAAAA